MVKLGKESGLHSFEQVTITFPILITVLHAVMRIKLTHSDPDLDSPLHAVACRPSVFQQTPEGLFQADFVTVCVLNQNIRSYVK